MKAHSRLAVLLALVLMLGVMSAVGGGTATAAGPTTIEASEVSPTPTPAGTEGTFDIMVHLGDEVDPSIPWKLEVWALPTTPSYADMYVVSITGNGRYPDEDCSGHVNGLDSCTFTNTPEFRDVRFTVVVKVLEDATVGAHPQVIDLVTGSLIASNTQTMTTFEVSAADSTTSTSTSTTTTTVLDKSTVIVTDADPDPVPVGGTGTYSATVHFGNDVIEGDQVTMMVDGDWADGVVDYLGLTTDAPGADCTLVPAPGTSQACSFTVALGTDYHFVTTVKVADDAVAPDGYELYATVSDFDDFAHSRGLYDFGWISIGPAETTTTEATTTSVTVAPTSIVSTTVAATTTENTLPNTGPDDALHRNGFIGLVLVLFGIVMLAGSAVLGQYRKQ